MVDIRRILELRERDPREFVRSVREMFEADQRESDEYFCENVMSMDAIRHIIDMNGLSGAIQVLSMLEVAFEWHENEKAG